MAGKTPRLYLEHIQEAIAEIDRFAAGKTFEDLATDNLLWRAIERESRSFLKLPAACRWP